MRRNHSTICRNERHSQGLRSDPRLPGQVRESHHHWLRLMRDLAMWFCWSELSPPKPNRLRSGDLGPDRSYLASAAKARSNTRCLQKKLGNRGGTFWKNSLTNNANLPVKTPLTITWFVPLSLACTSRFVPLSVCDHSQGVYFLPNHRRRSLFFGFYYNKQTNKQSPFRQTLFASFDMIFW